MLRRLSSIHAQVSDAGDADKENSKIRKRIEGSSPNSIEKVAVIGGGPAGLAAAACLKRLG